MDGNMRRWKIEMYFNINPLERYFIEIDAHTSIEAEKAFISAFGSCATKESMEEMKV